MSIHWIRNYYITLLSYNVSTLSHQTLNPYLLLKLEFISLFALCSQSLPFTFSKQCSEFPRQLGEIPPTQILFYLRQTDEHFYSTIVVRKAQSDRCV